MVKKMAEDEAGQRWSDLAKRFLNDVGYAFLILFGGAGMSVVTYKALGWLFSLVGTI